HCWAQVGALLGTGGRNWWVALLVPDHQGTDHQCPDDRCRDMQQQWVALTLLVIFSIFLNL
ncbi:unnamed protein product, partial [Staurois parvus]